jgi:hypothetical protein
MNVKLREFEWIKVRQKFETRYINDLENTIIKELDNLNLHLYMKKGDRIAITAGSRGIDRIPLVLKIISQKVKQLGGEPFLIPAMGGHGGATPEGQVKILEELGITSNFLKIPILSSMETVRVGTVNIDNLNLPVVMDKNAYESDGIIVVNRIKPHTSFSADIESGIIKMMVVGMGKKEQAENIHRFGIEGLKEYLIPISRKILDTGKIIAGVGIVENSYDKIVHIKAFLPHEIEQGEKELLEISRNLMPKLPVDSLDILVVEEIGKNISGTGMDTNIIGRLKIHGEPEKNKPSISRIVVLDLSPETKGNAYGIGLADFTTRTLVDKIDYDATYTNAITSTFTERVKIPIIAKDEDEAFKMAIKACGIQEINNIKAIRIKNTLELDEIWVSPAVYREIKLKNDE